MHHPMTPSQLEIEFFWPLTQQIPLDLDYSGCDTRPKITARDFIFVGTGITTATQGTITPVLKINEDAVTVTYKESPSWYRRLILKIIGFKWEKR